MNAHHERQPRLDLGDETRRQSLAGKMAKLFKAVFNKKRSMHLMAGGVAVVAFEMAVQPPEIVTYFLTPLALIAAFAGLFLYFLG